MGQRSVQTACLGLGVVHRLPIVTYPTVVAVLKRVVTSVRPSVETLPRVENRRRTFNFYNHSRFDKATYLPQFLDQGAPPSRTPPKDPHYYRFVIQRIEFLEHFNREGMFSVAHFSLPLLMKSSSPTRCASFTHGPHT